MGYVVKGPPEKIRVWVEPKRKYHTRTIRRIIERLEAPRRVEGGEALYPKIGRKGHPVGNCVVCGAEVNGGECLTFDFD